MELLPQHLSTAPPQTFLKRLIHSVQLKTNISFTSFNAGALKASVKPEAVFLFCRYTAAFFKRLTLIYLVLSLGHGTETKSSSVVRLELPPVSTAVPVRFGVKRQNRMDIEWPVL